jgi:hypothetical protein
VNLADGRLSWFFIVLTAEAVAASLTLLPLFFEKKRGIITLAGFTVSLAALLAACCIYTGGNWFLVALVSVVFGLSILFAPFILRSLWLPAPLGEHKTLICFAVNTVLLFALLLAADVYTGDGWFLTMALPIAAYCLTLPWGCMLIICYAKINGPFKAAGCLGLAAAYLFFMRGFIGMTLGESYKFGLDYNFNKFSDAEYLNGNIDATAFFVLLGLLIVFTVMGIAREINGSHKA